MKKGTIFIVSSPSGCGKTTIIRNFLKKHNNFYFSISHTTRPKRPREVDGKDYFFISKDEFQEMINNNQFLEWAIVHNEYYGTSKQNVLEKLDKGIDVILDIDVQGAKKIKQNPSLNGYDIVSIFIFPPSYEELKKRILKRNQDNDRSIEIRLKNAYYELENFYQYDYIIVNKDLKKAIYDFETIINANCLKKEKMEESAIKILKSWEGKYNGKSNN